MIKLVGTVLALALSCAGQLSMQRPDPAATAQRIRELEQKVSADKADLLSRDELVGRYRMSQAIPESGIAEELASRRIYEILLEMIHADPARLQTGMASRALSWRDPNYPALRAAWLEAAKRNGTPAAREAAAMALSPLVDHQEILRLVGKPTNRLLQEVQVRALVHASVYGDPAESAAAQTGLSLLSDAEQARMAGSELMGQYMRLQDDPTRKTEDLKRLRELSLDLTKRAGPAAVRASDPRRITVGGNVMNAMLSRKVEPAYPPEAAQARISGTVKFNAVIGKDGKVANLQLLSGHPLFLQSATDAVRQWEYKPTLLNGQPVEVATQIDVSFVLPN